MHGVAAQLRCILWKLGPFLDRFVEIKALVVDNKALVTMFCGRNSPCFHHLWTLEYVYLEILEYVFWKLEYVFWKLEYMFLEIWVCVSGNLGMYFWIFGYGFLDIRVLISGYFAGRRTGPGGAGQRLDPDPDPDGAGQGRSGQVRAGRGWSGSWNVPRRRTARAARTLGVLEIRVVFLEMKM